MVFVEQYGPREPLENDVVIVSRIPAILAAAIRPDQLIAWPLPR
jgi:hypothetical protein